MMMRSVYVKVKVMSTLTMGIWMQCHITYEAQDAAYGLTAIVNMRLLVAFPLRG